MAAATAGGASESTSVFVRPYPKIVYLYLTWIASLVCGLLQPVAKTVQATDGSFSLGYTVDQIGLAHTLGRIWIAIFVFNSLVIAFEFSRIRSVALAFFLIALGFAAAHWNFLEVVSQFFGGLELLLN